MHVNLHMYMYIFLSFYLKNIENVYSLCTIAEKRFKTF